MEPSPPAAVKGKRNRLHDAVEFGTYSDVSKALSPKLINQPSDKGSTPLHLATSRNRWWAAKALLHRKANPDLQDSSGDTPLHIASRNNNFLILRMLISAKADISLINKRGETAFHVSVKMGHEGIFRSFLELRKKDVDFNSRDGSGRTPLHLAAEAGSADTVKLLIDAGAEISALTPTGLTPLQVAVEHKRDVLILIHLRFKVALIVSDACF